jgi:hypothetical protein
MGTKASRKVYSKEFKSSAVAMVTEQGRHVASVEQVHGLMPKTKRRLGCRYKVYLDTSRLALSFVDT